MNKHDFVGGMLNQARKGSSLKFLAAVAFGVAIIPAHAAVVVNADFSRDINGQNPGTNPAPVLYASTGPAPDSGTVWNDLQVPLAPTGDDGTDSVLHPVQFNDLSSSTGGSTTIDIQLTSGFFRSFNGAAADSSSPASLQGDRVFSRLGNVATMTIQGLNPLSSYDLYFINSAFDTNYTINAVTKNSIGTTYDGAWTAGDEYASFSAVTPSLGGEIVVSIQDGAAPITGFGVIAGLQIVEVPEPSTVMLGGLGALALLRRRRR